MVLQLFEYIKAYWIVYFKSVNFIYMNYSSTKP